MKLAAAALLPLALGGCVTSSAAIRARPIVETFQSTRSVAEIERCVMLSQPGGRTVTGVDVNGRREVTVTQESAGAVMLLELTPSATGTTVVFRKKGSLVNYDDQVRACYRN